MNLSSTAAAAGVAAIGLATAALAAAPTQALDAGALTFTGPASVSVGVPAVMTATGHVPSDAFFARYVYVYSIPTSVVTTCPATHTGALQLSSASSGQGGDSVAFVPVEGDFSVPIAYTARQAGTFLLCAYLSEMSIVDAAAQHVVTASGATGGSGTGGTGGPGGAGGGSSTPGASAPVNTGRPKVVQRGNRMVCRRGTWNGAASYSYRWRANGKAVRGATRSKLAVTKALRGKRVTCAVTAKNAAGSRTVVSAARRAR